MIDHVLAARGVLPSVGALTLREFWKWFFLKSKACIAVRSLLL
jgi:hypothetical protein